MTSNSALAPTTPRSTTTDDGDKDEFAIEELVGPTGAAAATAGTLGTGSSAGCPSTAGSIGSAGSF